MSSPPTMETLVPLPEGQNVQISDGNFFTSLSNAAHISIREGHFYDSLSNAERINIRNAIIHIPAVPRNLVLCFDGTTNKFGKKVGLSEYTHCWFDLQF